MISFLDLNYADCLGGGCIKRQKFNLKVIKTDINSLLPQ